MVASLRAQSALAMFPVSLGLLRPVSATGGGLRALPQFSMVVPLRSQARLRPSLAYWAYYGLFPPQAAAFVRPSPVSAKILRISGRGNCKEAIFALENEIFRRKNQPRLRRTGRRRRF